MSIRKDKIQLSIEVNGQKAGSTYAELIKKSRDLSRELKGLAPGTDAFVKKSAELKKVNSVLADIRKETKGIQTGMQNTGGVFKKISGLAVAGFAAVGFAISKVTQYTGELYNMAVNLDQVERKAKVVFGDEFSRIQVQAEKNAIALGLTNSEYIKAATNISDLLIPMGYQRDEAANISSEVVNLSGALSEWSAGQYASAEVGDILSKAMLGEREQLKSLGISISEAQLQERLRAEGLDVLTGKELEQAKAATTLQLITEKSVDAQEAFTKNTGSLTKQKAELLTRIKQIQENLSKYLVPVFNRLVGIAIDAAKAVDGTSKSTSGFSLIVQYLVGALKASYHIIQIVVGAIVSLYNWLNKFDSVKGFFASIVEGFKRVVFILNNFPEFLKGVQNAFNQVFINMSLSIEQFANSIRIGMLKAQKFLTISSDKRKQLQSEIEELKNLNAVAEASGKTIGEAFNTGFVDALDKKDETKEKVEEKISNISSGTNNSNDIKTGISNNLEVNSGSLPPPPPTREDQETSTLGGIPIAPVKQSLDGRLEELEKGLDKELDTVEKSFLTKLFTEEDYRMKSLEAEASFYEKKLQALRDAGLQDSEQYRKIELDKLAAQREISEERIKVQEREADIKRRINKGVEDAAKSALDVAIDLLSQDEAARKKNASAIKAFEIGKVTIDGIKEVQGYFAGYASLGPIGQGIAIAQSAFAAVRTGLAIKKITSQKFAGGGFTGSGFGYPDDTGRKPVGIVHQDEYVAPTHQIERYPSLFSFLDQDRMKKYATGGFTSIDTTPRNISDVEIGQGGSFSSSSLEDAMERFSEVLNQGLDVKANIVQSEYEAKKNEVDQIKKRASI